LFNLTGTWRPSEKVTTFARLSYFSSRQLIYPDPSGKSGSTEHPSSPGVWLLDLTASIRDVVFSGLELEFSIRNLTDKEYYTPGTYSTIEGKPFSATVMLRKRW
jgi:outer membrane receptor protein involved in Fe transport